MSTTDLFKKVNTNAIKKHNRLMANPKKWNKEQIKMANLTNKHLIEKALTKIEYVFVLIDMRLYCINDKFMLDNEDFRCLDSEANEHTFNYSEIERIEK